jgi:hypothetical protein
LLHLVVVGVVVGVVVVGLPSRPPETRYMPHHSTHHLLACFHRPATATPARKANENTLSLSPTPSPELTFFFTHPKQHHLHLSLCITQATQKYIKGAKFGNGATELLAALQRTEADANRRVEAAARAVGGGTS